MPLTDVLAFLTLISLALQFWKVKEGGIKQNWKKIVVTLVIGVMVFFVTLSKNGQDRNAAKLSSAKDSTVRGLLDSVSKSNVIIASKVDKIDTLYQYIRTLDSLGIKRDSINNKPIITKNFTNNFRKVDKLTLYQN